MLREMRIPFPPVRRATPPDASPVVRPAASPVVPPAAPPARPAPASPALEHNAARMSDPSRGAQVSTMEWPALRAAVSACQACALGATRKQAVFGVGSERAHWMIVGEAPGEQEDLRGEPFVGAAGQLLDAMLRAVGLTRANEPGAEPARQVYIANTLKCRPPRNRNPEREEMQRCEPFLVRQIELLRPRLILAMGRVAVQSLLRTEEPLGRLRGRVHRYQGVPVVVTYHPAYLLRNLPDKAKAWEDLCLALQTMQELAGSDQAT
jgi:uracil-DNA glycosylase family 4